eukprot:377400-Hanusia_phi.AAC.3
MEGVLQEIRCFRELGRHDNLLALRGMTIEPRSGDYCLVTEYAPQGSLDQLEAAIQICSGMAHLALHGVIHPGPQRSQSRGSSQNPIADYGLAVKALCGYESAQGATVSTAGSTARPIRWMAPESIEWRHYTEKSDVWAMGVTMWEIWTYGKIPYGAITDDEMVGKRVVEGLRLLCPSVCPPGVYDVMQACWRERKNERPSSSSVTSRGCCVSNMTRLCWSYMEVCVKLSSWGGPTALRDLHGGRGAVGAGAMRTQVPV